ncbi:MAG: fumarylacetoacetate hydrolase family protein [Gammaproteobacteria bacterium]
MRLISFLKDGRERLGAMVDDRVVDLSALTDGEYPTMLDLLRGGEAAMERARGLATTHNAMLRLADLALLSPVPRPGKYLAMGLNYRKHAEEAERKGVRIPKHQVWFNKQTTCMNGPHGDVHMPLVSDKLDYEAELAVVIGKRCRHVKAEEAHGVIAGLTVANDVSVRDWQMRAQTWTLGKSFDTHGPLGPALVTLDEIPDPQDLNVRCYVNGERRQDANTGDMIYDLGAMIAHLTQAMTLEPGDVLATGTPAGIGSAMEPSQYLKVGDVVRVEIDHLGALENRVVAEPDPES